MVPLLLYVVPYIAYRLFINPPLGRCLKSTFNHPVLTFQSGHPSFKKEGKVIILNILTFSSSSEEEYPDGTSGGGGGIFRHPQSERLSFVFYLLSFVFPNFPIFVSNPLIDGLDK
jgi:hypothetical protein